MPKNKYNLQNTIYSDTYWPDFDKTVIFVGFNYNYDEPFTNWLPKAAAFAGFKHEIVTFVSDAKAELENLPNLSGRSSSDDSKEVMHQCIVNARYTYENERNRNGDVPAKEIPYCGLEGLTYYAKRKTTPYGFFQGFQFIRKIAKNYPNVNFAVYGGGYDGIPSQAKEMKLDFIPAISSNVYVPFTILEYLRNQNTKLFDK